MEFSTALVHLKVNDQFGATNTPVYLNNAFAHTSAEKLENIFKHKAPGYLYTRVGNPSSQAVERKIAMIEEGKAATLCSSGMSAIASATLNILEAGDEFISTSSLFGGTYNLFNTYRKYKIVPKFSKDVEIDSIKELITKKTKFVFLETLGNPTLDIPDIKEIALLCKSNQIPLIVDSTMTSPAIINPIKMGANIVIHSTSKYINGMSNAIGGVIVDGGNYNWNELDGFSDYSHMGKLAYTGKLRQETFINLGVSQSPMNAFLIESGLSTLAIRVEKHCRNALTLAKNLSEHPKIDFVNYPGLNTSRYYKRAKDNYNGKYGGLLTIRVGTKKKAFKIINSLKYFYNSANLGDVKSLIIHPASTIYASNSSEEKKKLGVYEDLLRVSVGIEDIQDLMNDFEEALSIL